MRKLSKDVLKMASGLISPSGLAGHRGQLCNVAIGEHDRLNFPTVCLFPGPLPIPPRSHISVQMLNKEKLGGCLARAGAEPPR